MSNAKLHFTKSFERDIKVDGKHYLISQDQNSQSLYVFEQGEQGWLLLYTYNSSNNEVLYEDTMIGMITRVLHQAQVDRYALKN